VDDSAFVLYTRQSPKKEFDDFISTREWFIAKQGSFLAKIWE
jgi:hypothetical protein